MFQPSKININGILILKAFQMKMKWDIFYEGPHNYVHMSFVKCNVNTMLENQYIQKWDAKVQTAQNK